MTRWPESVRRAVMATLDHEVPAVASMARWEPDERQRLRDHARLLATLTEFAEEYRVGCDAIGVPCQSDGEAHRAAMGRLRVEIMRQDAAAPFVAKDEARRAPIEDRNADASVARLGRVRALADNLVCAGVGVTARLSSEDWRHADPDGALWAGVSEVTIKRDKKAVKALLRP